MPEPTLIWGLFTRGLGVVFLISFVSLSIQVTFAAGHRGMLPVHRRLAKIEEDFPSWRRFYYFPTLLWLNRSDWMLRALTLAGIAASLVVIYGGPFSFWGAFDLLRLLPVARHGDGADLPVGLLAVRVFGARAAASGNLRAAQPRTRSARPRPHSPGRIDCSCSA